MLSKKEKLLGRNAKNNSVKIENPSRRMNETRKKNYLKKINEKKNDCKKKS